MSKIRFAVVGCGGIGKLHSRVIKEIESAELVAVCDANQKSAEELAAAHGAKPYSQLAEMFSSEKVDVVSVCVPSGVHAEVGVEAARAGKHVLVEKPIDVNLENADRLLEAARKGRMKVGVISQYRFVPSVMRLKEAAESGKLGRIVMASVYVKRFRSQGYYKSAGWRGTWKMDGGGALMNQGVHFVDLVRWIVGDVESLFAVKGTLAHDIEVEDALSATLQFSNGALGSIEASTAWYPGLPDRLEVCGTLGSAMIDDMGGEFSCVFPPDKTPEPFGNPKLAQGGLAVREPVKPGVAHKAQIEDFVQAIFENRQPAVTGEDGRKALEIILAAYRSSESGEPVKFPL